VRAHRCGRGRADRPIARRARFRFVGAAVRPTAYAVAVGGGREAAWELFARDGAGVHLLDRRVGVTERTACFPLRLDGEFTEIEFRSEHAKLSEIFGTLVKRGGIVEQRGITPITGDTFKSYDFGPEGVRIVAYTVTRQGGGGSEPAAVRASAGSGDGKRQVFYAQLPQIRGNVPLACQVDVDEPITEMVLESKDTGISLDVFGPDEEENAVVENPGRNAVVRLNAPIAVVVRQVAVAILLVLLLSTITLA
jgi:hypothetical protein